jgi:outer membrane protein, heavy metal efflux system
MRVRLRLSLCVLCLGWGLLAKADGPPVTSSATTANATSGSAPGVFVRPRDTTSQTAGDPERKRLIDRIRPPRSTGTLPAPSRFREYSAQVVPPQPPPPPASQTSAAPAASLPTQPALVTTHTAKAATDTPVRRVQAAPSELNTPAPSNGAPSLPGATLPANLDAPLGGQSMSLEAALRGTLTGNPDLVTLRQGGPNVASPESVEVARRFPTALNPTVWIDYRPITLVPPNTFGAGSGSGGSTGTSSGHGFYHFGQNYILFSIRQPVELGHQTTHRYAIARAALSQQQWTVMQAEMIAMVQTYRFFQTAVYRRERLRVARELADFNDRLHQSLKRRQEANLVPAADVTLALVESRAAHQQIKAAQQDYVTALTDLRNQVGVSAAAAAVEPFGEFKLPPYIPTIDEQSMVQTALQSRPDIHAAQALVAGTCSAVRLANGDRIPTPVIGPQYAMDEAGIQYVGLILVSSIPVLNNGKPLVAQRAAEHHRAIIALQQAQQRAVAQVRAAVARWNGATELVSESAGLSKEVSEDVASLERLFEQGQTDLTKLMQARQRLIQLENSQLDAVWAATQAQSDLLLALGAPILLNTLREGGHSGPSPAAPTPPPTSPATASPARR